MRVHDTRSQSRAPAVTSCSARPPCRREQVGPTPGRAAAPGQALAAGSGRAREDGSVAPASVLMPNVQGREPSSGRAGAPSPVGQSQGDRPGPGRSLQGRHGPGCGHSCSRGPCCQSPGPPGVCAGKPGPRGGHRKATVTHGPTRPSPRGVNSNTDNFTAHGIPPGHSLPSQMLSKCSLSSFNPWVFSSAVTGTQ